MHVVLALLATPVDRLHDAVRADDAAAVEAALREPLAKQSLLETRDALGACRCSVLPTRQIPRS